jgi:hypothetical protein
MDWILVSIEYSIYRLGGTDLSRDLLFPTRPTIKLMGSFGHCHSTVFSVERHWGESLVMRSDLDSEC